MTYPAPAWAPSGVRPSGVTTAVALLTAAAVCQLVQVAVRLAGTVAAEGTVDLGIAHDIRTALYDGVLFLGLLLAALFVMLGREGGRLAAVAMAGIACWEAFGWLLSFGFALFDGIGYWRWYDYTQMVLVVIAGGLAAGALAVLAGRRTAGWFRR